MRIVDTEGKSTELLLVMKKLLLTFTTLVTSTAIATSIHLATLEKPTDIQNKLSTTTNAIAIAGTTAIFGLLDDDNLNNQSDDSNNKKAK